MATTTKTCPKCSESVLSDAKKCKHCQADLRSWFIRHKILSGILALFALIFVSAVVAPESHSTDPSSMVSETQQVEPISITARQLYQEYKNNEISADAKYKGQVLKVSGTVSSIGKDILNSMYVSLKTDDIIGSIQCMLEDSEFGEATALTQGQSITVVGKNDGLLMNIVLRGCTIE